MFSLLLYSHINHYPLSPHASSLSSILSFPRGCLLLGFRFACVCVDFGSVSLFGVDFVTPYAFEPAINSGLSPFAVTFKHIVHGCTHARAAARTHA